MLFLSDFINKYDEEGRSRVDFSKSFHVILKKTAGNVKACRNRTAHLRVISIYGQTEQSVLKQISDQTHETLPCDTPAATFRLPVLKNA